MKNIIFSFLLTFGVLAFSYSQNTDEIMTMIDNDDYKSAINAANTLTKQYPSYAYGYYIRAYCYTQIKNYYNAKKDFLKSFELGYEYDGAYQELASIYFTEENYSQAVVYFKKQLELVDEITVHFNVGISYFNNKEYNSAIEYFDNVISINSGDKQIANAYKFRGRSKNNLDKDGCSDVIKGINLYLEAMNNKKQWAQFGADIDYVYNSYCVNKKGYNYYFKRYKKASRGY